MVGCEHGVTTYYLSDEQHATVINNSKQTYAYEEKN